MALVRTRSPKQKWPADDTLSWEARGLLAYLLTKPDDWEVQLDDLVQAGSGTKEEVRRILTELEERGYASREKTRQYDGTFQEVTEIRARPSLQTASGAARTAADQAPDRRPSEHESAHTHAGASVPTE